MQSPAPGGGITPGTLHTEGWAAAQHLCRKGFGGGPTGQQTNREPALHPCGKVSWTVLGKNTGSRSREVDSLHRTGEITSGVPYPVLGCTVEERNGHTAASPAKGHKYEWGTGICFIQGKRELRLFSIEKLGSNLFSVYKYPVRKCREEGTKIFSVVATDSTSGNKYKMKREKIHLLLCECPETGCPEGLCSLYL